MSKSIETTPFIQKKQQQFYEDVLHGLKSTPKHLSSKYFYDKTGDLLFQKIMRCPEYYLTDCELEILKEQSEAITQQIKKQGESYDVIGLGTGDGSKSVFLIEEMLKKNLISNYFPVDISAHVINKLESKLPSQFPRLNVKGFNGEYIDMLHQIAVYSTHPKIVLFLGSNIGNFSPTEAFQFCQQIRHYLQKEDLCYIGFDLKKHPQTILNAYNDKQGFTKAFNLNLLTRINNAFHANFELENFDHYPTYDPEAGTCKSFLISLKQQNIQIGEENIAFYKNEAIHMEVSQKYNLTDINTLAEKSGFQIVDYFFDRKKWFTDALWRCR